MDKQMCCVLYNYWLTLHVTKPALNKGNTPYVGVKGDNESSHGDS